MGLYLIIASFIILFFNLLSTNKNKVIYNSWSLFKETIYDTVHSIVVSQISSTKGQNYFPFMYALFFFILVSNLISLIPYNFASTSHFILTFSLSFTIVLGSTILALQLHQLLFFGLFVPGGCPLGLLPLLTLIESVSYLARNVSLGLRLGANIMAGHMLFSIISGFTFSILTSGSLFFMGLGLLPVLFLGLFAGLELAIAFIQAQVFVVLSSSYIKDGVYLHS